MSNRFITDLAIKHVWSDIYQDTTVTIKPARITPPKGIRSLLHIPYKEIKLPDNTNTYHVFQIGQLPPQYLKLINRENIWQTPEWRHLPTICTTTNTLIDPYQSSGYRIPLNDIYYYFTRERNLILAVKDNPNTYINYQDDIYLRLYTNAYFSSVRADSADDGIVVISSTPESQNDILNLQGQYVSYLNKSKGHVKPYVNGVLVKNISAVTVSPGDSVDIIYDSSIRHVVDINVKDAPVYVSSTSNEYRYILHYTEDNPLIVHYMDDVDLALLHKPDNGNGPELERGLYLPRPDSTTMMQLTHRDYSYSAKTLQTILRTMIDHHNTSVPEKDVYIRLYVKEAGYHRELVYEHNRLLELYKLPDDVILNTLTGIAGTLERWSSRSLENSDYTKVMSSDIRKLDTIDIANMFGYNAITKLGGDTPSTPYDDGVSKAVNVPILYQSNSTAYEYDSDGLLIGYYPHIGLDIYHVNNPDKCNYVEFIKGTGTDTPNVKFYTSVDSIFIDTNYNYRIYIGDDSGNYVYKNWRDITGHSEIYNQVGNKLVFNDPLPTGKVLMIRQDDKFLTIDDTVTEYNGVLKYRIQEKENRDGTISIYDMPIPMGELDLFMNGKLLVEGLDYRVKYNDIVITNMEYVIGDPKIDPQSIHIRYKGFCNKDFTRTFYRESGFVVNGLLSKDATYNIRDDRVSHISVDGRLFKRDEVVFDEYMQDGNLTDYNGKPFQLVDNIIPIKQYVDTDTYSFRDRSREVDKEVGDYLNIYFNTPFDTDLSTIPDKYKVYSPTFNALTTDVLLNNIDINKYPSVLNAMEIESIMKPYTDEYWYYDPANPNNKTDRRFVEICPHNRNGMIAISLEKFNFIKQIINHYSNNTIEVENYFMVIG